MNDFTMSELLSISFAIKKHVSDCSMTYMAYKPLIEKISSMIDNYCEHEFVTPNFSITRECVECKKYVSHSLACESKNVVQYK